jgi:hypothetical protein
MQAAFEGFDAEIDAETGRRITISPPCIVQRGQMWQLGRHRLLCGDTSVAANRDAVLDGRPPDLVLFDPPYDVAECWGYLASAPAALIFYDYKRVVAAVALAARYAHVYEFIWDCTTCWYTPNRPLDNHRAAIYASNSPHWDLKRGIYRDGKKRKPAVVYNTRGVLNYTPLPDCHVTLQTVFDFPKTAVMGGRPHAKPVAWVRALIGGSGARTVLDQFCGSGASIIGALPDVTVFGIEIDPLACDVILERWRFSGGAAPELVAEIGG